jgi:hypothetical protein
MENASHHVIQKLLSILLASKILKVKIILSIVELGLCLYYCVSEQSTEENIEI